MDEQKLIFTHQALTDERVVLIDRDCSNINLREIYDSRYGSPTWYDRVRFVVAEGVTVRSRSPRLPAIRTGTWPERPVFGGVA